VPRVGAPTLAAVAATLLSLVTELGHLRSEVDVERLHREATSRVKAFRERALEIGETRETVQRASYLLCSLIDETVLNTPWGEHSDWARETLLQVFHRETYGGDGVFRMIDSAMAAPRDNVAFLELAYLCLSLGFEGRYRLRRDGGERLEKMRGDIYDVLGAHGQGEASALSADAERAVRVRSRLPGFTLVWGLAAMLALMAFGTYLNWLFDLNRRSDQLTGRLAELIPPRSVEQHTAPFRLPLATRLRGLLAPEIHRGAVRVESGGGRVSVILRGDGLFASGTAGLKPAFDPLIAKVARALEAVPGRITVAGYTDNRPIRTARFPSNWQLSLARANAVAERMSDVAGLSGRLNTEGRGASDPVADNDSAAGRARNRRVTVELAPAAAVGEVRATAEGRD